MDAELTAELLTTHIRMKEFLELKVNDIIPSEKKIALPIDVFVNKRRKFIAHPGLKGKKRAVQIIEVQEEERMEVE